MDRENRTLLLISVSIVFVVALILYFQPFFLRGWILNLENGKYDREVRHYYQPLPPHPSIVIVDVDDRSIAEEGKWPWNRAKIAQLTEKLTRLGASVLAFDIVFSEAQPNPVDAILPAVQDPQLAQELEELKPRLDTDTVLAEAFKKSQSTLGFAFASNGKKEGELPPPLLTLSPEQMEKTLIPAMNGYIGNQPLFQQAAHHAGFINAMVDSDGILRFSPLVLRDQEKVYPALALQAAQLYLNTPFSGLIFSTARKHQVMEGIQFGSTFIPTDPWGRILIPFRGPPYSFPYLSATDLLHGKIAPEQVQGKLVFIGLSSTAASDLFATAISPVFPGVEVQASIASGILYNYLPYKPNWGRGAAVALVLILGTLAALIFPFISQIYAFLISFSIIAILEAINYWFWTRHGMVLSFFFPTPTLASLFALDLISIYLSHRRRNKKEGK
ncbi:MAG: CHASE2 domain-containing protein [Verrucomicrobiota bacterium]|nr:CHASE2 domain-containing protein [Verrucomicrobiota bacterium]